jgi:ABC-type oligopeptide transport system substrate-binding subunit
MTFELNSPSSAPEMLVNQISGPYPGSLNFGRVENPVFEETVPAAAAATNEEERCQLWGTAERSLMEEANASPIQQNSTAYFGNGITFEANYWFVESRTLQFTE